MQLVALAQVDADSAQCKARHVSHTAWHRRPASKLNAALLERKAWALQSLHHAAMADACGECCTDWLSPAWQLKVAEKGLQATPVDRQHMHQCRYPLEQAACAWSQNRFTSARNRQKEIVLNNSPQDH